MALPADFTFEPSRYNILRPEQLGRMALLESISTEQNILDRMSRFKALWLHYDPPNGAQYDVGDLEFDPIKIQAENAAFFELMLRDRVNQACRGVTLAFGTGTDLDAIASRYPGGVPRFPNESDARYRRRVWLSVNPLSPHGTAEAYEFWGLTAIPTLRDVRTKKIRPSLHDNPIIVVACLADANEPRPSQSDLVYIRAYIQAESRQAMTDEFRVVAPIVTEATYEIEYTLFPGVNNDTAAVDMTTSLEALVEEQRWLGFDHTRAAIYKAAKISGVHNVNVVQPAEDLLAGNDRFVRVADYDVPTRKFTKSPVRYLGRAE
jgi:phage-related baseplate assembly protein